MKRKICLGLTAIMLITGSLTACNKAGSEATPSPSATIESSETVDIVDETDPSDNYDAYLKKSETFVSYALDKNYSAVYEMMDESFLSQFAPEDFELAWEETMQILGKPNAAIHSSDGQYEEEYGVYIFEVVTNFQEESLYTEVVFSPDIENIISFDFNIGPLSGDGNENATDLPAGVSQRKVTIAGDGYGLDARIAFPTESEGKIPVIVLMSGMGSGGMNEIVGVNKVFKNLAYELAKRGVATLRYDTRSYSYKSQPLMTVDEEYIIDAISAKEAVLKQIDYIQVSDKDFFEISDVYVLGHDFSANITPRIAHEADYAGMIMLAGTPKTFVDNLYYKYKTSFEEARNEETTLEVDTNLAMLEEEYAASKSMMDLGEEELAATSYFGIPASYIKSIDGHPTSEYLTSTSKPALILQGGKDVETSPEEDYLAYGEYAKDNSSIEMKLYENLNHLFMTSTMTPPSYEEYYTPSDISEEVLDDIAQWIKSQ